MRTLKPMALTALNAPFQHNSKVRLVVVVGAMVSFDGTTLEQEQTIWKSVAELSGGNGCLDEIKPKVRGEALLSGLAFAPQGKPAPIVAARLTVGPIEKEVWAIGDRAWKLSGPTDAVPFTEMPLSYDRAFGGEGFAANPIGRGFAPIKDGAGNAVHPLPNLELAKRLVTSPRERPPVAGFGPVEPALPQRMKKAGTYDKKWLDTRYPEMAEDFDPTYFNLAPEDQWIDGYWQGGEAFTLQNMHREQPRIEGVVPRLTARYLVTRRGAEEGTLDDITLRCDTLWFIPHLERVIMLFRGGVDVADEEASDIVDAVVALERQGEPRSVDHYREIRRLRRDKSLGGVHALRDIDLLPDGIRIAKSSALREMDDLLQREDLLRANMRRRGERELVQARARFVAAGIDPDARGFPKELPPEPKVPELHELPAFLEDANKRAEKAKQDAEKHKEEALARLRETCAKAGIDLDKKIAAAKGTGGPPKFNADEHAARLRELLAKAKALGVPTPKHAERIEDPAFLETLRRAETAIRDAYRRAVHYMPPASAQTEPEAAATRKEVEAVLAAKGGLAGRDLTGADLSGLDFSECDLTEALMEKARLVGCSFRGAKLQRAVFTRADLTGADLHGAVATGANFGEADLTRAKLTGGVDLVEAVFIRATLHEADLTGAKLDGAQLSEVKCEKTILAQISAEGLVLLEGNLRGVDLRGAKLAKAVLMNVDLTGADLRGASLFRTSLVDVTIEDACLRGIKLERVSLAKVDKGSSLARSDLRGADLRRLNLRGVNLEGADLREADLSSADLSGANLRGAKLEAARAVEARFQSADLTDADLARADLRSALMGGAVVRGANFEEASLFRADGAKMKGDDRTSFKGANVKQVRVVPDRGANG
jgi:uncharacterized protein YjbI with pentapeptide repeats